MLEIKDPGPEEAYGAMIHRGLVEERNYSETIEGERQLLNSLETIADQLDSFRDREVCRNVGRKIDKLFHEKERWRAMYYHELNRHKEIVQNV